MVLPESSIAYVCNLSSAKVHQILLDFFAAFLELSRRTQAEVILDLKCGLLHLFKNGELVFENSAVDQDG